MPKPIHLLAITASIAPAAAGAVIAAAPPSLAAPATQITVTTTADVTTPGGCQNGAACSLRDAITLADSLSTVTQINAPAGAYSVSTHLPAIQGSVTLAGAGAGKTVIDGDVAAYGPLDASAPPAVVQDLTVSGASLDLNGGASVEVDGVVVDHPPTDAIVGDADSNTITDTTVIGSKDTGASTGRGIYLGHANGRALITNTTVTGMAEGIVSYGALDLVNDTLTGAWGSAADYSGSGLANYAYAPTVVSIINTILAGNATSSCESVGQEPVTEADHNLVNDNTCQLPDGSNLTVHDSGLTPVADNGGRVPTVALQPTSPAIGAADPAQCPGTDARGVQRPVGGPCDIGAYQSSGAATSQLPPTVLIPNHVIVVRATGGQGATATFPVSATNPDGSTATVSCTPASGALFPPGDTTVTCTATGSNGLTATGQLTVRVYSDATLYLPKPIVVDATAPSGAQVTFLVDAYEAGYGYIATACSWTSGGWFPIGTTTVSCSSTDPTGHHSYGQFTVTVNGALTQLQDLKSLVLTMNPPIARQTATALINQLNAAITDVNAGNNILAGAQLTSFIARVQSAVNGANNITAVEAQELTAAATRIINVLG